MKILKQIIDLYHLENYEFAHLKKHKNGKNDVYILSLNKQPYYVLRFFKTSEDIERLYQSELEFVHYLALNEANVADVVLYYHRQKTH